MQHLNHKPHGATKNQMTTQNQITAVYEIKQGRKWLKVRATSMKALSDWAKQNNVSDWRMCGMMSRAELLESQSLAVVA